MLEIPIAFSCNDSYVFPLCVALASLKKNKSSQTYYKIYILYSTLSEKSKEKISECCSMDFEVHFFNVDRTTEYIQKGYENKSTISYISKETMYRLYLPDLFPQFDKMIYLDCDLVVQGDLGEFYQIDLKNLYGGVVAEINEKKERKRLDGEDGRYFNAGVLLLNLKKMREDLIVNKLVNKSLDAGIMMDQDVLNLVIGSRVMYLPEKYNYRCTYWAGDCLNCEKWKTDLQDKVILHFTGYYKPWLYNMPVISQIFQSYVTYSSYRNYKLELLEYNKKDGKFPMMQYPIPDYEIPSGSRIVLYGAGKVGKAFFQELVLNKKYQIVHWVDQAAENYKIQGLPVEPISILKRRDFNYIIVAVSNESVSAQIKEFLVEIGMPEDIIFWNKPLDPIKPFVEVITEWKHE